MIAINLSFPILTSLSSINFLLRILLPRSEARKKGTRSEMKKERIFIFLDQMRIIKKKKYLIKEKLDHLARA